VLHVLADDACVQGTPLYMAPELVQEKPYTHRCIRDAGGGYGGVTLLSQRRPLVPWGNLIRAVSWSTAVLHKQVPLTLISLGNKVCIKVTISFGFLPQYIRADPAHRQGCGQVAFRLCQSLRCSFGSSCCCSDGGGILHVIGRHVASFQVLPQRPP
jgi:hypothetical protein